VLYTLNDRLLWSLAQGYVLGWGQNEFKQAVPPFRRIQESVIYSPTLISPELFAKHSIVQLAAGRQYSMALSENNQLFLYINQHFLLFSESFDCREN
jgi:alpha-tubulin suppressor-like RCC1 family protein